MLSRLERRIDKHHDIKAVMNMLTRAFDVQGEIGDLVPECERLIEHFRSPMNATASSLFKSEVEQLQELYNSLFCAINEIGWSGESTPAYQSYKKFALRCLEHAPLHSYSLVSVSDNEILHAIVNNMILHAALSNEWHNGTVDFIRLLAGNDNQEAFADLISAVVVVVKGGGDSGVDLVSNYIAEFLKVQFLVGEPIRMPLKSTLKRISAIVANPEAITHSTYAIHTDAVINACKNKLGVWADRYVKIFELINGHDPVCLALMYRHAPERYVPRFGVPHNLDQLMESARFSEVEAEYTSNIKEVLKVRCYVSFMLLTEATPEMHIDNLTSEARMAGICHFFNLNKMYPAMVNIERIETLIKRLVGNDGPTGAYLAKHIDEIPGLEDQVINIGVVRKAMLNNDLGI